MQQSTVADVDSITQIDAVPKILEAVSELTGLKFVCIARVTESVLRICAVLDKLNYGFKVGDSLDVTTTLCDKVREKQAPIIIDSVQDSEYRDHHAPKTYGFQSYFSIPSTARAVSILEHCVGSIPSRRNCRHLQSVRRFRCSLNLFLGNWRARWFWGARGMRSRTRSRLRSSVNGSSQYWGTTCARRCIPYSMA